MKLTKAMKEQFVRDVLTDVPTTDYPEQARALIAKTAIDLMPEKVRAVYDDPDLRDWIDTRAHYCWAGSVRIYANSPHRQAVEKETADPLRKLEVLNDTQDRVIGKLRGELNSVIAACSTLKQAEECLPEFSKYLPKEPVRIDGLPAVVVANVVSELTRAGWPK